MSRALAATLIAVALPLSVQTASADAPEIENLVCSYDWDCATALSIVWEESRDEPEVVNPSSGAAGLFQIMPLHGYPIQWLQDPANNVWAAYQLYLQRGWQPWGR